MTKSILRLSLLALLFVVAGASEAFATHFRFGTIRWQPTTSPNVIQFTVTLAFRRSFPTFQIGGLPPAVGTVVPLGTFNFGHTASGNPGTATMNATVTSVSTTEDWIETTYVVTKTFPAVNGTYTAFWEGGDRLATLLESNANRLYRVQTTVTIDMGSTNRSPSSGTIPILRIKQGTPATIPLVVFDPDGDPLTYDFSQTTESLLQTRIPNSATGGALPMQVGATTGVVTFTPQLVGLYAVQFVVSDGRGARIPIDLMIQSLPSNTPGQAPTMLINGVAAPASFTTPHGQPLTFTLSGTDPEGGVVTLVGAGLPVGVTLNPSFPFASASPANATFTWTPPASAVGTYVLSFAANDNVQLQDVNTVTIVVAAVEVATSTAVTAITPAAPTFGQAFSTTAVVTSTSAPVGTVQFLVDGASIGTAVLAPISATQSQAAFTYTGPPLGGAHVVTATYLQGTSAGTTYLTSTSPDRPLTIAQAATTTAITGAASTPFGQTASFTITVSPPAGVTVKPAGTVTVLDGGNAIGAPVTLNANGQATFAFAGLTVGAHSILAQYNGDSSFLASVSPALPTTVSKGSTTTAVATSPNPSTWLSPVTLTATVTPNAGTVVPTGTVTFKQSGSLVLGTAALNASGVATITNPPTGLTMNPGTWAITVEYGGDASYNASASAAVNHTVNKATVLPRLSASPASSTYGQAVAFRVVVDPPATMGRDITLRDGATVLGTSAPVSIGGVDMGQVFTVSNLNAGAHTITADTLANQFVNAATANLPYTVLAAPTTTTLSATPNPSVVGTAVTLSATVTAPFSVPGGTVTFKEGAAVLAGPLVLSVAGTAQAVLPALTVGGHAVVAEFTPATANYVASAAPLTVNVLPSITVTSITLETRQWFGPTPTSSQQAIDIYNALPLGVAGYAPGPKTVTTFAGISNQATFNGSNSWIGYHHHFAFNAAQDGVLTVRMGGDFGGGGTLIVDGQPIDFKGYDIWWNGNFGNPSQHLVGTIAITAGAHVIDSYGFENGLDGPQQAEWSFGGGPFTIFTAPANTVPVVQTLSGPTTVDEGETHSYSFTVVDPDAGATFTAAASCGANGVLLAPAAIAGNTGTFDCSFPAFGSTTVSVVATDNLGAQSGVAARTVTIADAIAPVLTLPASVTLEATDANGATHAFEATATDAVDTDVTVTCSIASGSYFPLGVNDAPHTTTVSCTATDDASNATTGTFTVTVQDTTAPALTVPDSLTVPATSLAGANYEFAASATDSVDANVTVACSPAGPAFPFAGTGVTCTATDNAGNETQGAFSVMVTDQTAPVITVPGPIVVEATGPGGALVDYTVTAFDSFSLLGPMVCEVPGSGVGVPAGGGGTKGGGGGDSETKSPPIGDGKVPVGGGMAGGNGPGSQTVNANGVAFPIGTHTLSCIVTDHANNSTTATFTVTVQDTTAPALTLPDPATIEATGAAGAAYVFSMSALDVVDGALATTCSAQSGDIFPLGPGDAAQTTTVSCTATDAAGNTATGSFGVTVQDTTAPGLTVPDSLTLEATSPAGADYAITTAATDLVDPGVSVVCTPAGPAFGIGATPVSCTATDNAGNATSRALTVTVADTIAPLLTMPASVTLEATGAAGATHTFAATATDTGDPSIEIVCTAASGDTFPLGANDAARTTTVSCTATDDAGNPASGSFNVTVQDTTAPGITVPDSLTLEATSPGGAAYAIVAPATDVVDTNVSVVCTPGGPLFPIAGTLVSCVATDNAGNNTAASFTVTVADRIAPVLTMPASVTLEATGAAGAAHSFAATATDIADTNVAIACTVASGATFPLGVNDAPRTTAVSCTATDDAGNATTASFNVTVRDTSAPSLIVPPNQLLEAVNAQGAPFTFTPAAADTVDASVTITCTPGTTGVYALGVNSAPKTTPVSCIATDNAGNTRAASFTVTVRDTTAPALTVPTPITTPALTATGAPVSFTAVASDAVSATTTACTPASGTTFAIGATTVTCTSTDVAGNSAQRTFTVNVTNNPTPGWIHGGGHLLSGVYKHDFNFSVVELSNGVVFGAFKLQVCQPYRRNGRYDDDDDNGRRTSDWRRRGEDDDDDDDRNNHDFDRHDDDDYERCVGGRDRFVAKTFAFTRFSNDPTFVPGNGSYQASLADTLVYSGTGYWNGRSGYTYEVKTTDRGEPGKNRDTFEVTIKAANGTVVAVVPAASSKLTSGNVQSGFNTGNGWWNDYGRYNRDDRYDDDRNDWNNHNDRDDRDRR